MSGKDRPSLALSSEVFAHACSFLPLESTRNAAQVSSAFARTIECWYRTWASKETDLPYFSRAVRHSPGSTADEKMRQTLQSSGFRAPFDFQKANELFREKTRIFVSFFAKIADQIPQLNNDLKEFLHPITPFHWKTSAWQSSVFPGVDEPDLADFFETWIGKHRDLLGSIEHLKLPDQLSGIPVEISFFSNLSTESLSQFFLHACETGNAKDIEILYFRSPLFESPIHLISGIRAAEQNGREETIRKIIQGIPESAFSRVLEFIPHDILVRLFCEKANSPIFINSLRSSESASAFFGSFHAICLAVEIADRTKNQEAIRIILEKVPDDILIDIVCRKWDCRLFFKLFCLSSRSACFPLEILPELLFHCLCNRNNEAISTFLSAPLASRMTVGNFREVFERFPIYGKHGNPRSLALKTLSRAISREASKTSILTKLFNAYLQSKKSVSEKALVRFFES